MNFFGLNTNKLSLWQAILLLIGCVVILILCFVAMGWVFQQLWNWVMPELINAPKIGWKTGILSTLFLSFIASFFRGGKSK